MNHHYNDILSRIPEEPIWWDEHAVPRYCEFGPREVANIYADECCLVLITCQGCQKPFKVAFSRDKMQILMHGMSSLKDMIENKTLHYGDPPNTGCCSGTTMNSEPRKVLEYWHYDPNGSRFDMVRVPELETYIEPDWVLDPEEP